jgi:hypothetical protein
MSSSLLKCPSDFHFFFPVSYTNLYIKFDLVPPWQHFMFRDPWGARSPIPETNAIAVHQQVSKSFWFSQSFPTFL